MRQLIATICLVGLCFITQVQAATVLVMGDSISAAFGLETQQGWVALLNDKLTTKSTEFKVVNASVSGETTAGGLARFPDLLRKHQPQIVIIELGGNDGLRGLSLEYMAHNLTTMLQQAQEQDATVLLLGMRLPGNYGRRYTESFYQVYQDVAKQHDIALVDYFFDGVGGVSGMMQADGVHPTQAAQPLLLKNAWRALGPLLSESALDEPVQ